MPTERYPTVLLLGTPVTLSVEFASRRNISSVSIHTSNFNRYGAAVFSKATLSFRPSTTSRFSPRRIEFEYVADKNFETARWVRIPVPDRLAVEMKIELFFAAEAEWLLVSEMKIESSEFWDRVDRFEYVADKNFETARWVRIPVPDRLAVEMKIELFFAAEAEWLLVSEMKIESSKTAFNYAFTDPLDEEIEIEQRLNPNSLTYFAVGDDSEDYSRWISLGVLAALLLGFASLCALLYILCCCKRQSEKLSTEIFSKPGVHLLIETGTVKKMKPPAYSSQIGTMEHAVFQNGPIHSPSDSSSEYAEPDCGSPSQPLLQPKTPKTVTHYASSDLSSSWYHAGTATICSPLSSYSKYVSYGDEMMSSSLVEIDRRKLHFVEKLGQGEFGTVDLCRLENRLVAVKTASDSTKAEDFRREIGVMSRLRHQNVVEVIGVCSADDGPLTCIIEFMQNGDLCQYLRQQSGLSSELLVSVATQVAAGMSYLESRHYVHRDLAARNCLVHSDGTVKIGDFGMARSELLVSVATQVAAGMSYLESRHYVHRDLAARNCLVHSDGTVKIGDFGMARSLYSADYYKIQGRFRLPIRWMAWECLLHGRFTSKSDVWAFGVTLWEILNGCRQQPFGHFSDDEVVDNLQSMAHFGRLKNYLSQPDFCSSAIYNQLMVTCWHKDDAQRPSFATIHRHLQALLCHQLPTSQEFS
uniref:receptor protein-tyrosine kinase n=1 Tax=Steinernema glaseri TaxID=37863 RepID=A0A1I7ZFJ6_9BILA